MLEFLDIEDPVVRQFINMIFLGATGFIAWHGLRVRDKEGKADFVHLLFGCIAAFYFFAVLFQDVLGLIQLG
ncbi:MAG: hypothetical protein VCD33_13190 [Alphaproteobacteria bacterium]|jgi:hypothetical protein